MKIKIVVFSNFFSNGSYKFPDTILSHEIKMDIFGKYPWNLSQMRYPLLRRAIMSLILYNHKCIFGVWSTNVIINIHSPVWLIFGGMNIAFDEMDNILLWCFCWHIDLVNQYGWFLLDIRWDIIMDNVSYWIEYLFNAINLIIDCYIQRDPRCRLTKLFRWILSAFLIDNPNYFIYYLIIWVYHLPTLSFNDTLRRISSKFPLG